MSENDTDSATDERRASPYRALVEHLDDGYCVIELLLDAAGHLVDYRFLEANPAFERQTGLAGAVGRTARALVPGLEASWVERYGRVAATREPARFELRSEAMGRWFDVLAYPVGPPAAHQVGLLFADVSGARAAERERAELLHALEVERARLASIFEQAPAFLAVLRGPTHVFSFVNQAYYQLVGHRAIVGKPAIEALPEVRDQGFITLLDGVRATGEPVVGRESRVLLARAPGFPPEERFVDFVYLPLVEPDGTRSGVIAHGADVTEQVRARREAEAARDAAEAARERTERLQAVTAALSRARTLEEVADVVVADMVVALGARTGALAAPAPDGGGLVLLRTVGFPEPVVAGVRHQPLDFQSPLVECLRTSAPIWIESREGPAGLDARYPPIAPVWDRLGVGAAAFVPLVAAGEPVGVISFAFERAHAFADAERAFLLALGQQAALAFERARLFDAERAARAAAEAEQRRAEAAVREAETANEAKSGFLATMSHELRTPINAIIGYAQLLDLGLAGTLSEQQRAYVDRVTASSQHLLGLIDDVLDLSKIEAGEIRVAHVDAYTGAATRAALDLALPLASAKGVRLVDGRPDDEGVPFVGDEDRVRQIVLNLLSNAVKFTGPGGHVTVTCDLTRETPAAAGHLRGSGPWAVVRVADTGVGIVPEEQGRIFEPFHQVEAGHTRRQGGTGLGLAISRRLARLMDGDLTVESAPGAGSAFTLWLPAPHRETGRVPETAGARIARAEREIPRLEGPGLQELGEALHAVRDAVLDAYVERLRAEPSLPDARGMRRPHLEDHAASLITDLAQSLVIVAAAGADAVELLRDGSAIQRAIAEAHGARRHAQGWDERAVWRDHAVFREEVERAARERLGAAAPEGGGSETEGAIALLLRFVDRAEAISVRAWRRASGARAEERAAGA